MDRKTLKKLVKRLARGRIARGDEAKARKRLLDDLYSAGVPTEEAATMTQEQISDLPGHTLLAWGHEPAGQPTVDLFVLPDHQVEEKLRNALDAVNELELGGPLDCSLYQYAAAIRVMAALGLGGSPGALMDERVAPAFEERGGEGDLSFLPGKEELEELWGRWRSTRLGHDGSAGGLDRRFTHAIAVRQMP